MTAYPVRSGLFAFCRYTTNGGRRENLEKGTLPGDDVFSGKVNVICLYSLLYEI